MIELVRNIHPKDVGMLAWGLVRGTLFWKYVVLIGAVMGTALVMSNLADIWFTVRDHRAALVRIQEEQATSAAARITQFVKEMEGQLGWLTLLSWSNNSAEQRELDTLRLMRQVPAISELTLIDGEGRERLRVSRQAMDRVESHKDLSQDERYIGALTRKTYYGPVEFRRGTEPIMTLAMSGPRRESGVAVAEVNLTHIWDVIHTIRVGRTGRAYVVGPEGRLIAHPDISLVLRNTDMSNLEQVRAARGGNAKAHAEPTRLAFDIHGEPVLTAHAKAEPLDWLVFVELPESEANEPLYTTITRSLLIAIAGLAVALLAALILARRMVVPIQTLSEGAGRIGAGGLDHRITIKTGDELETLGEQFNEMAAKLQTSYSTLERKVAERTEELQAANFSKSRFLAVASHDLRQPLHALNLLVAQLHTETDQLERDRIASRVGTAVGNMNELFNALLDISKLEAGAQAATISNFPVSNVFSRIDATFGATARDKGLHFAVVSSTCWVRSDSILLERILINLVSNAVRYTREGGVVVGCRRLEHAIRIDVFDTGVGIPAHQQNSIFDEFYRGNSGNESSDGLGLGLAIVERLGSLLDHQIQFASKPGAGSRFSISLPIVAPEPLAGVRASRPQVRHPSLFGKLIIVLDDDQLVLEATAGILASWGCEVVAAPSVEKAIDDLAARVPDLVISDYRLADEQTGIDAIRALRNAIRSELPAFIVSGDIAPLLQVEARNNGLHLLQKPLSPVALRAMVERAIGARRKVGKE